MDDDLVARHEVAAPHFEGGEADVELVFAERIRLDSIHPRIDYPRMEEAIRSLTAELVRLQGEGDYEGARALFERYARLDDALRTVFANTSHIPTDIRPVYPERV